MNDTRPAGSILSPTSAAYLAALDANSDTATVTQEILLAVLDDVQPGLDGVAGKRLSLASILDELTENKAISTPKDRQRWDAGRPPLPTSVRIHRPKTPRTRPEAVVWRPELSWASTVPLTPSQVEHLTAINRWLRDNSARQRPPAPMRERSHEIFGDEKRLESLLATSLFAPGRLTLKLLNSVRLPAPLAVRTISTGTTILVAENSDTFHSLCATVKPDHVSHIGYGCGKAFESSVTDIEHLPRIDRILYFGDLDAAGLAIPIRASTTAQNHGLPPVEPAIDLYAQLLKHRPSPAEPTPPNRAQYLVQWLPQELQCPVRDLLIAGRRIAQEALNRDRLSEIWNTPPQTNTSGEPQTSPIDSIR